MPRVVASIVNFLWAGFAATLIAAAAVVSIVRLLLPEIGTQKEAIESWITNLVGRPAIVGGVEASWDGWAPRIAVSDIAFLDPSESSELMRFKTATINIAPLGSLSSGSLKPKSLTLSGVALTVLRDENGNFSVAGMPPPKSPILQWLVRQNNFKVTDADLKILDASSGQTLELIDLRVSIRDQLEQKVIAAVAELPEAIGGHAVLRFSADADPLSGDWNGTIDFRLAGVKSSYVLSQLGWVGPVADAARMEVNAWSEWDNASLARLRFDLRGVRNDDNMPEFSASGLVSRRDRGWQLDLGAIEIADYAVSTKPAGLSVAWHTSGGSLADVAVRGEHLPLEPANKLAVGFGLPSPRHASRLQAIRASGLITSVRLAQVTNPSGGPDRFAAVAIENFSSLASDDLPAVIGADFRAYMTPTQGQFSFDNTNMSVSHAERLVADLKVNDLKGRVAWHHDADEIHVHAEQLRGTVQTIDLRLDGVLRQGVSGSRDVDLVVHMPDADARRFHELIPVKALPPRGEAWVRGLFLDGRLLDSRLVLRGRLDDFPFREAEGVLAADFRVIDATARYSKKWPAAAGVDGDIRLRGPTVTMDVHSANVLGAFVADAEILMPELFTKQRFVHITGTAAGPANSATAIIMNSPLKNGKAARLADLEIGGNIEVDLDVNSGLFPGGPREVLGQARFAGNRVDAPKQKITLDDVTGIISFTRGDWHGEGLTAMFAGAPVGLVFNGGLDDPNYDSEFRMTGVSTAGELRDHLKRYAPPVYRWLENHQSLDVFSGELPWKAVLTIPAPQSDGDPLPRKLLLESSLRGLAIDMPWPFGKAEVDAKPFRAKLELLDGHARSTVIDMGDELDARIHARRDDNGIVQVDEVEVLLGTIAPDFEGRRDFSVGGYIPHLAFSEWARLLGRAKDREIRGVARLPLNFDVQVSKFGFLGTNFSDLRLHGRRDMQQWEFDVVGEQLNGNIIVPRNFADGTLHMNLTQLAFDAARNAKGEPATTVDPQRIPAFNLKTERFSYGDIELGRAEIETRRAPDGLSWSNITFANAQFQINATGEWLQRDEVQSSRFDIELDSRNLAELLERFGYSVANIDGGETSIRINAGWPGNPAGFALAHLDGTFDLNVTDGQFLDIEPGGGRLFGLLSVQSLPRRLLLDFDDLFRKGFKFDRIEGVFAIENGNAYTNGLLISGPAARIDISGRTGLAEQDYDQHVIVTPALSSSIPVAGALFGPIGVGAGAVYFLGQKMFKSIPRQIDKFLSREYAITGPWDNPSVEKI